MGDVPDFKADAPPEALGSFIMLPEGVAKLFAPDFRRRSFPGALRASGVSRRQRHASGGRVESDGNDIRSDLDSLGTAEDYPYVALTYRLTEHFHYWTKHVKTNALLQSSFFVEIPEPLANEKGIRSGDRVRVTSARGAAEGPAMVTKRIRPLTAGGRTIYQVGLPIHWGYLGRTKGPLVNLTPSVLDPNSGTPEYKGFLINMEKV